MSCLRKKKHKIMIHNASNGNRKNNLTLPQKICYQQNADTANNRPDSHGFYYIMKILKTEHMFY